LSRRKVRLRSIAELDEFDCTFMERILKNENCETRQRLEKKWSQNAVEYELFRLQQPLNLLEVKRGLRGKMTIAVTDLGISALFSHRKQSRQLIEYKALVAGVPTQVEICASMKGVDRPSLMRSFYVTGAVDLVKEIVQATWLWHLDLLEKEPLTSSEGEAQLIINVKFPRIPKPPYPSPPIEVENTFPELGHVIDNLWFFLTLAPSYHIHKVWMRLSDWRKASDQTIFAAWEKMRELYYKNVYSSAKLKKLHKSKLGYVPSTDEVMAYNILFGTLEELYQKQKEASPSEHLTEHTYRIAHAVIRSRSIYPPAPPPPIREGETPNLTAIKFFRTLLLKNFSEDTAKYLRPPETTSI